MSDKGSVTREDENKNVMDLIDRSFLAKEHNRWIEALLIDSLILEYYLTLMIDQYKKNVDMILSIYGMSSRSIFYSTKGKTLGDLCNMAYKITKQDLYRKYKKSGSKYKNGEVVKFINFRNNVAHGLISSHKLMTVEQDIKDWYAKKENFMVAVVDHIQNYITVSFKLLDHVKDQRIIFLEKTVGNLIDPDDEKLDWSLIYNYIGEHNIFKVLSEEGELEVFKQDFEIKISSGYFSKKTKPPK